VDIFGAGEALSDWLFAVAIAARLSSSMADSQGPMQEKGYAGTYPGAIT
jgi:hypothetical protein